MSLIVARGQVTITQVQDSYTLTQSVREYIFPASSSGTILQRVSFTSLVGVSAGDTTVTNFTIGTIDPPPGFASITVDNSAKTITYTVNAGTSTLADSGTLAIPIIIEGVTHYLSFAWSKARQGPEGGPQKLPEWLEQWDTGKTEINGEYLITPKLFAGEKNPDGTVSGVTLGRLSLPGKTASGSVVAEQLCGVYGFHEGRRTFSVNSSGDIELGCGDEYIRYNASTGKIEFGAAVAMQWAGATYIDSEGIFTGTLSSQTLNAVRIDASQITSGTINSQRIDVAQLKAQLISAANINALTLDVVRGKVGGWTIDTDSIYRGTNNNTAGALTASSGAMTIGSNGIRGYRWVLEASGAGKLAGGNISWDAAGNVTFANSVSLYWINAAAQAKKEAIDSAASDATVKTNAAKELAQAMAYGRMLYRDPTFTSGMNSVKVYNLLVNENVVHERIKDENAPTDSKYVISIKTIGEANPHCGGFCFQTKAQYRKVFIARIIAKIPLGRAIESYSNSIGLGGSRKWLTPTAGTGDWCEYIHKVVCGTEDFINTHFFALSGQPGTPEEPVEWRVAYATVFDITSAEMLTTTIDANGIYTGTLSAEQVNAVAIDASSIKTGTIDTNLIAAGTINADKLNVTDVQAKIITTNYIQGLSLDFTRGKIGGWNIEQDAVSINSFTAGTPPVIQLRATAAGSGNWYSGAYRPAGLSMVWNAPNNAGHIVLGDIAVPSAGVRQGFRGIQMMDSTGREYFCLSANTRSANGEVYNHIAGWVFDNHNISKNNVVLSSDGSIINGSRWKLNNDGSGLLAAGAISWDAAGNITFSDSVSLNWSAGIDSLTSALGGSGFAKLTHLSSEGIYTGTLSAEQINVSGINADCITTGTLNATLFAAGSIKASKLDSSSIKSQIINASYINGLSINFQQGKIGDWIIRNQSLMSDSFGSSDSVTLQMRTTSGGSGPWFNGSYRPKGFSLMWQGNGSAGHIVMGQVAASPASPRNGYFGIQMMGANGDECFCLSTNLLSSGFVYHNRIAGWAFDGQKIWKNNVSLSADGSITAGEAWSFNNDGSGQIAKGNISWDENGNVSFSTAVSLKWNSRIGEIMDALGGDRYPKMTYITATGIYTGQISARQISVDTALVVGGSTYNGSISVRDASNNVKVTLNRTGITAMAGKIGGWTISSTQIYSGNVVLSSNGNIRNSNKWQLNSDGSGSLSSGKISWDTKGLLSLTDAVMENVYIKGNIRNAFVKYDSSIWVTIGSEGQVIKEPPLAEKYDNLCVFGGKDSGGWEVPQPTIPWTTNQSGRRLCLVHYKFGNDTAYGRTIISAPSGKYFYENGRLYSSLQMAREVVELIGYGTPSVFYGWIVLNRRDLYPDYKNGSEMKYLMMGTVKVSATGAVTHRYKTYDGLTAPTPYRSGIGIYKVYLPWSLGADKYMVMLTGLWGTKENTSIYGSVKEQLSSSFTVRTQDDDSVNEGSFNYMVIGTADFK